MTRDTLIDRLRATYHTEPASEDWRLCCEAANEIERLMVWIERTAKCKYLRKQPGYHGRRVSMEAERMLAEPGWEVIDALEGAAEELRKHGATLEEE